MTRGVIGGQECKPGLFFRHGLPARRAEQGIKMAPENIKGDENVVLQEIQLQAGI